MSARVPTVSERAMPSVEVAKAVTFPGAPVAFPRIVFAPICASLVSAVPFVASVSEPLAPPTSDPKVPEYENSEPRVAVVVATFAKVFAPEKYGRLPITAAVEVPRPLKPRVAPLSVIGQTDSLHLVLHSRRRRC